MDASIGSRICLYEFCLLVRLKVSLVPVMGLIALLCPTGIDVLMAFLVRVVVPKSVSVSFLYLLVLITGVALLGSLNERGINNLALI